MWIAVQIQYSAACKVEFLWQITINMQNEDKKFTQHKIQYTVAQCRELVWRKDQMNRNFKKEGKPGICVIMFQLQHYIYVNNIT